jgi:hypothetical protein
MYDTPVHTKFSGTMNGRLFSEVFHDVRSFSPEKYKEDVLHEIFLRGKSLGLAEVVAVRKIYFREIRNPLSFLITGKPAHYMAAILNKMYAREGKKLHPEKELMHVIWKWKKRELKMQQFFLEEWWIEITNTQTT